MSVLTIQRLEDESTTEQFNFTAFCECCGKAVKTCISTTEACYRPKLFMDTAARRAKELLWLQAHEQARENAAREALQELNRCEICGALVCNACTVISDALDGGVCCVKCAAKLRAAQLKQQGRENGAGLVNPSVSFADSSLYTREPCGQSAVQRAPCGQSAVQRAPCGQAAVQREACDSEGRNVNE